MVLTSPPEALQTPARYRLFLRRASLGLTLLQAVVAGGVYLRGFPYFGSQLVSNAPLWEAPVALFHLPGILVLSLAGLCCGFGHSLVLGPRIVAGHVPVSVPGVLILAATNWVVWSAILVIVTGLWRLGGRKRGPAGPGEVAPTEATDS
jgi:hypothetical protein